MAMTRTLKPFRFVLILATGVMFGMGLSVGRSVQAERDVPVEPRPATDQPKLDRVVPCSRLSFPVV